MKTVIPVKSQRVEGADAKLLCTVGLQELGRSGAGVGLQSCAQSSPIDLLYVYICPMHRAALCRAAPCTSVPLRSFSGLSMCPFARAARGFASSIHTTWNPSAALGAARTCCPISPRRPPPCPVCSLCTDGSEELQSSRRTWDRCKLCAEHHQ